MLQRLIRGCSVAAEYYKAGHCAETHQEGLLVGESKEGNHGHRCGKKDCTQVVSGEYPTRQYSRGHKLVVKRGVNAGNN
jgi:hypothetical protein